MKAEQADLKEQLEAEKVARYATVGEASLVRSNMTKVHLSPTPL